MENESLTVEDLIIALQEFPRDMKVVVHGYEGGYSEISENPKQVELLKNVNSEWYYGNHDHIDSVSDPENYQKETFILISRRQGGFTASS